MNNVKSLQKTKAIEYKILICAKFAQFWTILRNTFRSIFEYGFYLTDKEKSVIRSRIKNLKKDTVPWSSPYDYTYAHKLESRMNAKLYKFSRANLKKYYWTRKNCVLVVDILIKDNISILTPKLIILIKYIPISYI